MNEIRFGDRVAIVTGGSSGIDRAHALYLAKRGAKVLGRRHTDEERLSRIVFLSAQRACIGATLKVSGTMNASGATRVFQDQIG